MVNVLLADDHQIVKDGLKIVLQSIPKFAVVDEASNGDELLEKALQCQPNLIISDLKMPGESIIETSKMIKTKLPEVKIIILTAYDDSDDIYQALDSGIDSYIMKDTLPQQILNTIEMVLMGYSCFQPKLNKASKAKSKNSHEQISLTEREREVFELIIDNYTNAHIAERLYISEATVKTHVSSILRKTGQPNRSQAVLYALKTGYVQVS
ncbi:DNA-binding response regulator [Anaerobacillus alkaliphilus]|uniref:DNA-binding response regulator n=1 Tax=Anaerobacillus alkaliphilus TaxID=1548597 RepID=A0A4Q0VVY9_9BACI|nr:response regulator transcription factor [Anaerobacillus alkaliphilus]RXJ02783.1 DNA-binding response regulator [Anaerobacillus alkaliphilus]